MAFRCTIRTLLSSKRITLPRLSPTHTRARIDAFCVAPGDAVQAYDLVMKLTPTNDLTTPDGGDDDEPAPQMSIDTQDEGVVRDLRTDLVGTWVDVDTKLGTIVDDDDKDDSVEDWIWQAYKE